MFIILCMETDNMEKEGSLSMEIEGTPIYVFPQRVLMEKDVLCMLYNTVFCAYSGKNTVITSV